MCKGISKSDVANVLRSWRWWSNLDVGPTEAILKVNEEYAQDTEPNKINLLVGAYTDDAGKAWVLPSVRKASDIVFEKKCSFEYDGVIEGEVYTEAVAKLAFGEDSNVVRNKTHYTVQTVSGTGALRIGLEFIKKYFTKNKEIWLSNPTWGNHAQICKAVGLPYKQYRYIDPETKALDFEGALEDICKIPEGSIILLHACSHNPTGVDPTLNEWQMFSQAILERHLFPFFDMAYQGLASGNVDKDAAALRLFVNAGHQVLLAQSFVKNMGLYGERTGALTFLWDEDTASDLTSRVKMLIRTMYFKPPLYGARLVSEILNNPELKQQWLSELKQMAYRIKSMRAKLRMGLENAGNKLDWKHLTDQTGMYGYTGLSLEQIEDLARNFHIYLTKDGRMSMASVTEANVDRITEAFHQVTTTA